MPGLESTSMYQTDKKTRSCHMHFNYDVTDTQSSLQLSISYENMLVEHEAPAVLGELLIDKNLTSSFKTIKPLFRASKYILSSYDKTLLTVVLDQPISGALRFRLFGG